MLEYSHQPHGAAQRTEGSMSAAEASRLLNLLHARVDARIAETYPSWQSRFRAMTREERDEQEFLRAELRDHAAAGGV